MAKGRGAGAGRDILIARGLAEWLLWHGRTANAEVSVRKILEKYELAEPADEIVVLLANIIGHSTGGDIHGIQPENNGGAPEAQSGVVHTAVYNDAGL